MEYMSVKEAAEKWGTTVRSVQNYCIDGRIDGAVKISGIWVVPEGAEKPVNTRKASAKNTNDKANKEKQISESMAVKKAEVEADRNLRTVMPLMNTPYEPGSALASANAIEDKEMRNIALAEYYYFSGHPAKASDIVEPYLVDSDLALQLSACLIYAYSNLALDRIPRARQAMTQIQSAAKAADVNTPPRYKSFAACIATAAGVLLHLPLPEGINSIKPTLSMLPTGIRLFALYIEAHGYYLSKRYHACIAVAETALALEEKLYPIPSIYLHLVAAMGHINLKEPEQAKEHLLEAWKIAQPDDMIEAFGEHHGLLGGLLEAVMKKEYPDAFKRIIKITYSFSAGWRKVHNPVTGHYVADDLTTTEFTVAMLASRGWSYKEIASHLHVSTNTVRSQSFSAMQKLGISQCEDIKKFMLK